MFELVLYRSTPRRRRTGSTCLLEPSELEPYKKIARNKWGGPKRLKRLGGKPFMPQLPKKRGEPRANASGGRQPHLTP